MKTNTLKICLASILALVLSVGCSRHTSPTGAWSATNGERIEFMRDGTFTLKGMPPGRIQNIGELSGTYTLVDPTHLKLDITTASGKVSEICQFSVSGGELILQEPGKGAKRFQKAKN